ncbi:ATP-dependent Clp protease proteolytic subunit [Sesbania bispinosa]|nr:ATP-dependent Clp protease proteolytic subunit [Sesbania bispinosa]
MKHSLVGAQPHKSRVIRDVMVLMLSGILARFVQSLKLKKLSFAIASSASTTPAIRSANHTERRQWRDATEGTERSLLDDVMEGRK